MVYSYEYPRPSVTADCIIFDKKNNMTMVLLVQRKHDPFAGKWALPGGFINENETPIDAAARELKEETGIEVDQLRQIGAFGEPGRDPRGWTITVAFVALARPDAIDAKAADDASDARWFDIANLPPLAFDHDMIIEKAKNVIGKEFAQCPSKP